MTRRTVEDVAPQLTIWPIAPRESVTGMPTASPEEDPLSMVTVSLQESVDPEMILAAFDFSLYVLCRLSRSSSRSDVFSASSSSALRAFSFSFSALSSESDFWLAVRFAKTFPSPWNGAVTTTPT